MRHFVLIAFVTSSATSAAAQRMSYGLEVAVRSGHADRGFIIADRPVVQPVAWLTAAGAEFSVWSSFTLAESSDGARPQIVELELTRNHKLGRFEIGPALRMYYYYDALSVDHSLEGWLNLSYDLGPFRLFTNPSLDILSYKGAYFIDSGIESEGHVSPGLELGGSVGAGWGSWRFNDAYAGVQKSALNRISAEGWFTAYVKPRLYIGPHLELNTTLDPDLRAAMTRPDYLLLRVALGGEF